MDCNECGGKCCQTWAIVELDKDDAARIPRHLYKLYEPVPTNSRFIGTMVTTDKVCSAWDKATKRCSIYVDRPRVCMVFEFGGKRCLELRGKTSLM